MYGQAGSARRTGGNSLSEKRDTRRPSVSRMLPALLLAAALALFSGCGPGAGGMGSGAREESPFSGNGSLTVSCPEGPELEAHGNEAFAGAEWADAGASRTVKGEPAGKGLRKLALDGVEEGDSLWLYPLGEKLLLVRARPIGWGGMLQARLTAYDPYEGTEEAEIRLTLNGMEVLQVCGETVALWQNGALSLYDGGLRLLGEYASAQAYSEYWVPAGRDRVYCMDGGGRCLSASLEGGEAAGEAGEELKFTPVFSRYYEPEIVSLDAGGETFLIRGTDPKSLRRQYYAVDAGSGRTLETLGQYPEGEACSAGASGDGGGWLIAFSSSGGEDGYSAVSVESGSGRGRELASRERLLPVEGAGVFLSARQEADGSSFSCWAPDGSFLSAARFSGKAYFEGRGKTAWLQGGACLAAVYEAGDGTGETGKTGARETGILFWNPGGSASEEEGEPLALKRAPAVPEGELAPLYERAAAIGRRFGVELQIGEWVELTPVEYDIEPLEDYRTLEDGLDILEETMARYPDGFFEQLLYGDVRGLKIALTGGLSSGQGSGYPVKADGYVTEAGGYLEMALSLEDVYYLPSVFTHETAHLIDRRLAYDALYDVTSPFSEEEWNRYNPEGFSYDGSYDGERRLEKDQWGEYFLDGYCLTYPTEDRAELMKDAMSLEPVWAGAKSVRTSPLLQEKFRYYCACIRSAFDTRGWPETTAWEEALQTPEGVLPAA